MSSTSTNKQPLLIDRPLIEVEVLTTAAVGDRNQDTYRVQGGQGPVLLVDMDRTLSDDDISGGVIDTIELIRNEATPDVDIVVVPSGLATQVTYTTGAIVEVASGFFDPDLILNQSSPETIDVTVTSGTESILVTFAPDDLVFIPSGLPLIPEITTAESGVSTTFNEWEYVYISQSGVVGTPASQLPSGTGVYQYIDSTPLTDVPADLTYIEASGFRYLSSTPGTATLISGYYLYTGTGFSSYESVASYTTASGFTRLGDITVYYKFPETINSFDVINVTTTSFVNSQGQIPNGVGVYQYTGTTPLIQRPDVTTFTPVNGFTYLGSSLGSYDSGPGYYRYLNINSLTAFNKITQFTILNGFEFIGNQLSDQFEEIEVCFYHVRQKVNPVANDGDYKFIGSVVLDSLAKRTDALDSLPHASIPVPQVIGDLAPDKPGKNRVLYLQRGDALYCGLYATSATAVNYSPGVTVLAQGGYY